MRMIFVLCAMVSAITAVTTSWASRQTPACGTYLANGKLMSLPSGVDILEINPRTRSHFDIVMHGLSAEDATGFGGRWVRIKLRIYHSGPDAVRAEIQSSPSPSRREGTDERPLRLLKKETCSS